MRPTKNSLVLYKNRPALVKHINDKLEIELEDGKRLNVRPKDVTPLHPGPLQRLSDLHPQTGEIETAWELLIGSTTVLSELAELIYEAYTPATAWAAWQLVAEGLYFRGTPDAVEVYSPEEVAQKRATQEARAAEAEAWATFIARVRSGRIASEDDRYLREVEDTAYGRKTRGRVLRELGRTESPESAHSLLLELGYWNQTVNPYPQRLGLSITPLTATLPEVPDVGRTDLTYLPAFAIDDAGSQDPDDALSLEGTRLWVHIADAAAVVPPDSPADLEARSRGANLYLPEQTVPMLPQAATQALALGLADLSPALSFGIDLGNESEVVHVEIVPSWVRVQRLTYEEAEARLAEEPFRGLDRIAQRYQAHRRRNGAIRIELPEVRIRLVEEEIIIRPLTPLKSRDLVREAMLIAGGAIARYALAQDIPFPFTTQDFPEETDFPETMSGMFARRRSLQRSQIRGYPSPHAGLGLDIYTQATSPLRRYVDLVVHQQLRAHLQGERLLNHSELMERVGAAEAITGTMRQAERLANKHWTLVYLLQHPGWRGQGVLVDKHNLRGTILIPELDLETHLHLRQDLPLDSTIPLVLNRVNLPGLEAYFRIEPA